MPSSGVGRFADAEGRPPYWAYPWAGGNVLARQVLEHPKTVDGLRVVDFGSGSGIVGIAAMKAGAASVLAIDPDPHAAVAARLNAEANCVVIQTLTADSLDGPVPDVDLILAGDVFYDEALAARSLAFLRRCKAEGRAVLIGDPDRRPLPKDQLICIARHPVADFGGGTVDAGVYRLAESRTGREETP